jgi:hypothetical protein
MGCSTISVDLVENAYQLLYLGVDPSTFHMVDVALTLYIISMLSCVALRITLSLSNGDTYKERDNERDHLQFANYSIPEMSMGSLLQLNICWNTGSLIVSQ